MFSLLCFAVSALLMTESYKGVFGYDFSSEVMFAVAFVWALVNSAQLEIMLLKKNIQPHFILNTLTSIEQWITKLIFKERA
jgi:hypothetical protein